MFIAISNVLSEAEIAAIRSKLDVVSFVSGKTTAGTYARTVKQNEQATLASTEAILSKVEATLSVNPMFKAAAMPKSFVKLMVSRYREGMQYGTHVDEPMMNGIRTDLSFTLFLADPSTYQGGELVIEENDGTREFKLEAGSLILYPATTLHHVAPVDSGERLAIVGWVRSLVRDDHRREIIFDLETAIAAARSNATDRNMLDRLYKVRANLVRMWVDD